jgi:hypothetical protein
MRPGRQASEGGVVNDDPIPGGTTVLHRTHPRRLALGLVLSLAVTAAACGDDDETSSDDTTPAATEVSAQACDDYVALGGAMTGDPSAAGGIIEAFEASAPEALADEAATVAATFAAMAEGGEPAFGDPGYQEASAAIADAYVDGCETSAELDVDGVDYGFEGLPEEVDAGRVAIRFTNATEHDEPHELVLFRRMDGVTESVEELLALPEEEAFSKVEMKGVVFADAPGSEATTMVDLEPGSYIALCFIPIGGGEDGPPHFTGGMVAEFDAV